VKDRPRVLLLWPGGVLTGGWNFGVPQLLMMANAIRRATDADVHVIDLDVERALGPVDLTRVFSRGYDLVGISCYSSFDYLKVLALAARARELLPRAWLVTGGYHVSARPGDFTGKDSPFDFAIVGDGETPLARLVEKLAAGKRPLTRVLGPEPVPSPSELVPYDWSLLERYRPVARRVASQAEIYLSRGCPYDCSFCMERAKRETSWRALTPGEAYEELERLDRFLDLSGWTLFVADALFGMKRAFRRELLEMLARKPLRALRIWLLIRVDLVEREDLELMARANVSPGFGLESGDPEQLRRIRKSGNLRQYLDKMLEIAGWARELDVPFGANIIVGHPGETEATMRASAAYMRRLFLDDARGTHGFLSVDPFRLYPGSPIDEERGDWEAATGMKAHRFPWWHDGDQDFLSEWVDPSGELDYRRALALRKELFDPIVRAIAERFAYQGPAREYFMRSVREQLAFTEPSRRLRTLGLYHLWRGLVSDESAAETRRRLASDHELAESASAARRDALENLPHVGAALREVLERVPRERFVPAEDVARSAENVALSLTDDGASTISSLEAYSAALALLELSAGDTLADLGAGTGYGSAVAAEIVGDNGSVVALEIEPELARLARENLAERPNVSVLCADAHDVELWHDAQKVFAGFALDSLPSTWLEALAEGAVLVAPVGRAGSRQELTRFEKRNGRVVVTVHGAVRYVADRQGPGAAVRASVGV
jgi:protein-L-isoaspartate(D-aspartate) O-methyltransferase